VQIVIALIVTPEGLPLAYEVLPGNTNESTTLRAFLAKIEKQYGKAQRIWCMDRAPPDPAGDRRTCTDIAAIERHTEDLIGLSLEETKVMTCAVQRKMVEVQARETIDRGSICPVCQRATSITTPSRRHPIKMSWAAPGTHPAAREIAPCAR
jgi:hypothetical protein